MNNWCLEVLSSLHESWSRKLEGIFSVTKQAGTSLLINLPLSFCQTIENTLHNDSYVKVLVLHLWEIQAERGKKSNKPTAVSEWPNFHKPTNEVSKTKTDAKTCVQD